MSSKTLWGRLAACCAVALLAVAAMGMGGDMVWQPEHSPPPVAVPSILLPSSAQFLKLDSTTATVASRSGARQREIRVALRRTYYSASYLRLEGDRAEKSPPSSLLCYELLRTDGDRPDSYSWAMWRPNYPWCSPESFWLFKLSTGQTYLVFAEGLLPSAVIWSLANVTYPRDRVVAFAEDLARDSTRGGDVLTWRQPWLPEPPRTQQRQPRLEPTSLTLDEDGNPVLKFALKAPQVGVRATLAVRDGKLVCVELTFAPGQASPAKAQEGASVEAPSEAVAAGGTSAYQPRTSDEIRKDLRRARLSNVNAADPQAIFQECLPGLRDHANEENVRWFGTMDTLRDSEAYRRIIAVGPRMVPLIVEQLGIEADATLRCMLGLALSDTSGFVRVLSNPWLKEPTGEWWAGGQALTNERFELLYAERKSATIRCLGLATLPKLVEKLADGDYRVVWTIRSLTSEKANLSGKTPAEKAASCLAWWEANKAHWLIPFPDTVKLQKEAAEAEAQAAAENGPAEAEPLPAAEGAEGDAATEPPPAGTRAYERRPFNEVGEDLRKAHLSNVGAPHPEAIFRDCLPGLHEHAAKVGRFVDNVTVRDSEAYRRIIAVGPRMVRPIVEALRTETDPMVRFMLGLAVGDTSGFMRAPKINPWAKEPIEEWWAGGQKLTNERFDQLYAERNLKVIRCLGRAALPKLMEKLAEGDYELLSTVDRVTLHKADLSGETPAEQAASCLAWWEANKVYWLIPFPDTVKRQKEAAQAEGEQPAGEEPGAEDNRRPTFEEALAAFRAVLETPTMRYDSGARLSASKQLHDLVRVGPPAIPKLLPLLEEEPILKMPLVDITRWFPSFEELRNARSRKDYVAPWFRWWEGGQTAVNERFDELYERADLRGIRRLGIAALPKIAEKLREGDERMMRVVGWLRVRPGFALGGVPESATKDSATFLAWWEANEAHWLIPFPDTVKLQKAAAEAEARAAAENGPGPAEPPPAAQEETGETEPQAPAEEQPPADEQPAPPEEAEPAQE